MMMAMKNGSGYTRVFNVSSTFLGVCMCLALASAATGLAGTSEVDEQSHTILHSHHVAPGYKDTTVENIPDKDLDWTIEVDISWSGGVLRNEGHTGDFTGSFTGGFSKLYTPGDSTTGYYGHFYGDIIPQGGAGGGSGPPPNYRFDVYVKGGIGSFTVSPDQAVVPVPADSTETTTFSASDNAEWTWTGTMTGAFSADDTSGSSTAYDAYCTHAGSYALEAEKYDDDKITATATYIPTGVQKLRAWEEGNPGNWAETVWPAATTPVTAGDQPDTVETAALYVPYTEDESGNSTTTVNFSATPFPTSEFPDGEDVPAWTLMEKPDGASDLPAEPGDKFDYNINVPGVYGIKAECGNELNIKLMAISLQLSPNNSNTIFQGDTKTFVVTRSHPGRPINWSVTPNEKIAITNTGELYFKPYGDKWLSDFTATVTVADSAQSNVRDSISVTIKGLKRPGSLTIQGTEIDEPAWVGAVAFSVNGSDDKDSDTDSKQMAIEYQSDGDICSAYVTKRQFKYQVEYILTTEVTKGFGDLLNPKAAAAAITAKEGIAQHTVKSGCATKNSFITLSLGPFSVPVPLPDKEDDAAHPVMTFTALEEGGTYIHAAKSTVALTEALTGYAACETVGGVWSDAEAHAAIRVHALPEAEGQYDTLDAITFIPKEPESP